MVHPSSIPGVKAEYDTVVWESCSTIFYIMMAAQKYDFVCLWDETHYINVLDMIAEFFWLLS